MEQRYIYATDEQIRDIHHHQFAGWAAWSASLNVPS